MALSNENTLSADTAVIRAGEAANSAVPAAVKAVSVKKRFDWFGMTARAGELLFEALKTLVKYFIYGILWVVAALLRVWPRVAGVLKSAFSKAAGFIKMPFRRYKRALKIDGAEITRAKREKGVIGGAAAGAKVTGRILFGKRGIIVTAVNWILPVVSCVFLFNIISYTNSQTYALKLTVNGDFLGYINDETIFTDAEKMVQKRINYTGSNTEIIVFEPGYEVQSIGYGDTLNVYQTADKILELMGGDIKKGYGLYIGDAYFGTLEGHSRVDVVLEELLNQYRTDNPKESVRFDKEITFIEGKYLKDSFVNEDDMISTLTSKKQASTYYTVQSGDSPALISQKVGMTFDELDLLNPGFSASSVIYSGERVYITQDVPFLSVIVTREEHYDEVVPFETQSVDDPDVFVGDQLVGQTGRDGMAAIVANVSYINGIEVNRSILSTTITTAPVTQVMLVGVTPRPINAGPATTVPEGQFYWPVGGYGGGRISQMPAIHGGYAGHKGVDIASAYGTPIYAGASGTIIEYKNNSAWNGGRGNYVAIRHDNGLVTIYMHMSAVSSTVYVGKRVTMAEFIGYMGATGNATGVHLHFEVQYNGVAQDPIKYLPAHR